MKPSPTYLKALKALQKLPQYTHLYCAITHEGKVRFGDVRIQRTSEEDVARSRFVYRALGYEQKYGPPKFTAGDRLSARTLTNVWSWGDGTVPLDAEITLLKPNKKGGEKLSIIDLMRDHLPNPGDKITVWAYPFSQYTRDPKTPRLAEVVHCTSCLKSSPTRFDVGGGWGSPLRMDFPEKVYQIVRAPIPAFA